MNISSIIPLFLVALCLSCGTKLTKETQTLVNELDKYDEITLDSCYLGIKYEVYQVFNDLKNTATFEELVFLTKHKNPVVQAYSALSLVDRKYPDSPSVFSHFLTLKDSVYSIFADQHFKESIAYLLYNRVVHTDSTNDDFQFYSNLANKLDSLIFFSSNLPNTNGSYDNFLVYVALHRNHQAPSTYERVRDLALTYKNKYALVELAKYQNELDVLEIKQFDSSAFEAISFFPHYSFWELIRQFEASERSFSYFKAVAAFNNESAVEMMTRLYEQLVVQNDITQLKNLYRALVIHYTPQYLDLIIDIFENNKIIDESTVHMFINEYPQIAPLVFANGLAKHKPLHIVTLEPFDIHLYLVDRDSLITEMLNVVRNHDPDLIPQIFEASILADDLHQSFIVLELIRNNRLRHTIPPLLKRLDQKNFPFTTFHVAKTLLMFEDQNTKEQVGQILRNRRLEWDSGNWSGSFRELFTKYDIEV